MRKKFGNRGSLVQVLGVLEASPIVNSALHTHIWKHNVYKMSCSFCSSSSLSFSLPYPTAFLAYTCTVEISGPQPCSCLAIMISADHYTLRTTHKCTVISPAHVRCPCKARYALVLAVLLLAAFERRKERCPACYQEAPAIYWHMNEQMVRTLLYGGSSYKRTGCLQ
jgi:hypothetical protein